MSCKRWAAFAGIALLVAGCLATLDFDAPSRGPFPEGDVRAQDAPDRGSDVADAQNADAPSKCPGERETNDGKGEAQPLDVGASICGTVSATDPDTFKVAPSADGYRVLFDVDGRAIVNASGPDQAGGDFVMLPDGGSFSALTWNAATTEVVFMTLRPEDGSVHYVITRVR
jgi:hypothetical protein